MNDRTEDDRRSLGFNGSTGLSDVRQGQDPSIVDFFDPTIMSSIMGRLGYSVAEEISSLVDMARHSKSDMVRISAMKSIRAALTQAARYDEVETTVTGGTMGPGTSITFKRKALNALTQADREIDQVHRSASTFLPGRASQDAHEEGR